MSEQAKNDLHIDICICTFRREHVEDTIRSVAKLVLQPHWKLHIIVADNDETPSAAALVERVAEETGLPVTYVHAPAFNISVARNACLDKASAPFVAFVDDDEVVSIRWLESMMTVMEQGADIVLGPVDAIYEKDCPEWMVKGDFHSTRPVYVKNEITTGYSGNVLIRRQSPSVDGLRFRNDLGISGGEDTAFFSSVYKAGGIIRYASGAIATEPVSAGRASASWLLKRYFRCGCTHGMLLLEETGNGFWTRMKLMTKAALKAEFCMMAALLHGVISRRIMYWVLRGTVHVGVVFSIARNAGS